MLAVPSGVFYDDYPLFAPASLASEISEDITTLLDLLGWDHARDGSKAKPFNISFDVLGMNVNLGSLNAGSVILSNKEGRVARIVAMLRVVEDRGFMEFHESQVLHGLMNYASGFFSGRTLKGVCAQTLQAGTPWGSCFFKDGPRLLCHGNRASVLPGA